MTRPMTRKLPAHRGVFSYSRIPMDGSVIYRLFRRDAERVLHCTELAFCAQCSRSYRAEILNGARHRLCDQVDTIDLQLMGVTQ